MAPDVNTNYLEACLTPMNIILCPVTSYFFLNMQVLRWITKYKYLGTILTDDLSDDSNMLRQRGICYARCNSLIRNLSLRFLNVKVNLMLHYVLLPYMDPIQEGHCQKTTVGIQPKQNEQLTQVMTICLRMYCIT